MFSCKVCDHTVHKKNHHGNSHKGSEFKFLGYILDMSNDVFTHFFGQTCENLRRSALKVHAGSLADTNQHNLDVHLKKNHSWEEID